MWEGGPRAARTRENGLSGLQCGKGFVHPRPVWGCWTPIQKSRFWCRAEEIVPRVHEPLNVASWGAALETTPKLHQHGQRESADHHVAPRPSLLAELPLAPPKIPWEADPHPRTAT